MNAINLHAVSRSLASFTALFFLFCASTAYAQRDYTVVRPRQRSSNERVTISTKASQPSKGVLAVVLNPVINGQIIVKDANGRIISRQETGAEGKAEIPLQRGKIYQVEANSPGYLSASSKSKALKATEIIRLTMTPQFVSIRLRNLPAGAQVLVDDQAHATTDQSGLVAITDVKPGTHTLTIRHRDYNDYVDRLENLKAGEEINYGRITLARVAKLAIRGPANTTILIDGAVQGKINADGALQINYPIDETIDRTISAELVGYQAWSKKFNLKPGPHDITIKLDPIVTSAGVSDFFDNLSLWSAPASWKIVSEQRNKKLRVSGEQTGALTGKTYRDFRAVFTIWLDNGKGASWMARIDKEGRNYYLFHMSGPNSTDRTPRRLYTYVVKDGAAPQEVSTPIPVIPELNTKGSYTIEVVVQGDRITHTITSNETGETNDLGIWTDESIDKDKFLYGSFGFRALAGEIFTVDDLSLESIREP